mmetsp:Transcript_2273/g.6539  ORF Transcript_2273/g.6539 Transcript_2273/m.6539 type:complete len:269 (-) Transcript_2273:240-1046(-)
MIARLCNALVVFLVLLLYGFEWVVYNFYCQPAVLSALLFNLTLFVAITSYLRCSFTDPGTPVSAEWKSWACKATQGEHVSVLGWTPGKVSWCEKCGASRPERAHHCSSCGCCVLRMDHHCPWIGNCVGWRNHRYFLQMLLWTFLTSVAFCTTLRNPSLLDAAWIPPSDDRSLSKVLPFVGIVVAVLFGMLSLGLFLNVLYSAAHNETAIESCFEGKNPYCLPSWFDNLRQLLGPLGSYRLWLPLDYDTELDGTTFPVFGGEPQTYGSV